MTYDDFRMARILQDLFGADMVEKDGDIIAINAEDGDVFNIHQKIQHEFGATIGGGENEHDMEMYEDFTVEKKKGEVIVRPA